MNDLAAVTLDDAFLSPATHHRTTQQNHSRTKVRTSVSRPVYPRACSSRKSLWAL